MGALFIDRDPKLFSIILNYLRTKDIDLKNVDLRTLRHEAEYYGVTPLVKRLMLCEDLTQSSCGDVLFYGYLPPPSKFCAIVDNGNDDVEVSRAFYILKVYHYKNLLPSHRI